MTNNDIKRAKYIKEYGDRLDKDVIIKLSTPWATPFTVRAVLIFLNNNWRSAEEFASQEIHVLFDIPNVGPATINFISERLGIENKLPILIEPKPELLKEMSELRSRYGIEMFRRAFYKYFNTKE